MSGTSCSRTRRAIPLYLEAELDPADSIETAFHLARCGRCAGEAERGRTLLGALRRLDEPEPPRDVAAGVLRALRAARSSIGSGAALKWASLAVLLAALIGPGLFPDATLSLGVRAATRLGELADLEAIVARSLGSLPGLLAMLAGLFDSGGEGLPVSGGAPPITLLILLPALLLAAGVVLAFLSGGLVLTAASAHRLSLPFPKSRTSGSFDNTSGLP